MSARQRREPPVTFTIASVMRRRRCGLTEASVFVEALVSTGEASAVYDHSGRYALRYVLHTRRDLSR